MDAYIVTGASRGLGEAIVRALLDKEVIVYCLSRTVNEALIDLAAHKNVDLDYITYDLNDVRGLDEIMSDIMEELKEEELDSVYLINNAGILKPIKPSEKCSIPEFERSINVNLLAPMVLISEFIKHAAGWQCKKRVMNISSGAARKPYFGWSSYCTTKAGLDMYTQAVGLEQDIAGNNIKVMSIAPGIIDTNMQAEIRETNQDDFVDLERFIGFQESGSLSLPEDTANKLLQILDEDNYVQGALLDIRDFE